MKSIKHALFAAGLLCSALSFAAPLPGAPRQADMRIDAVQRQAVIDSVIAELHKTYVFPEHAKKIDAALRQHQKRGDYAAMHRGDDGDCSESGASWPDGCGLCGRRLFSDGRPRTGD